MTISKMTENDKVAVATISSVESRAPSGVVIEPILMDDVGIAVSHVEYKSMHWMQTGVGESVAGIRASARMYTD